MGPSAQSHTYSPWPGSWGPTAIQQGMMTDPGSWGAAVGTTASPTCVVILLQVLEGHMVGLQSDGHAWNLVHRLLSTLTMFS